jgi:FkbM family methyltransferase
MLPRVGIIKADQVDYMVFANSDLITNEIFRNGEWDRNSFVISKTIYSRVEAPLILDIGANLGAYSLPIAKDLLSAGGEVIAFEPQEIIYYQLCGNIILNRLDNLRAHHKAVGQYNGDIEIPKIDYNNNYNAGAFSFHQEYRQNEGIEESIQSETTFVPIVTLDSLVLKKPPALIKIDVEGYELDVFKGGVEFLKKADYPPILFEAWNKDFFREKRAELLSFVENLGYDLITLNQIDFIAQHKKHEMKISFVHQSDGTITIEWQNQ